MNRLQYNLYSNCIFFHIYWVWNSDSESKSWISNFHSTSTYEKKVWIYFFVIFIKTWTRWNSSVWFILVPDMATWTDPFDNLLSVIINNLGLPMTVMWQCYKNIWHSYSILVYSCTCKRLFWNRFLCRWLSRK